MNSPKLVLMPYLNSSSSAKSLSTRCTELLGRKVFRVSKTSLTYNPRRRTTHINWGSSQLPVWSNINLNFINKVNSVSIASNKLLTFRRIQEVDNELPIPEYTTEEDIASTWFDDGKRVCLRSVLCAHSGMGLSIIQSSRDILPVPLYVKYIPKRREYRVHVVFDEVVDVQQKKKRRDVSAGGINYEIRSHQNGWVFCREEIQEPANLRDYAVRAVKALGLDFGAVDIIWNERQNQCYVLEVNTAPGLEGATVNKYAEAFCRKVLNV